MLHLEGERDPTRLVENLSLPPACKNHQFKQAPHASLSDIKQSGFLQMRMISINVLSNLSRY
jgi:hypothetical protein